MAKFTIGIPTYNRAGYLRRSLKAACEQSWGDVEVVVSDNASTDETPEVVRTYGERIRYHRNRENIGMWANLVRLTELAGGEYFSWLQDDDLIHHDFARRAAEAFARSEDIVFYASYAILSPSATSINRWDTIHGPLIPVDWMGGEPRVIDGLMALPLCLFQNIAISPAIAFRTSALRRITRHVLADCPHFNESIVTAGILGEGKAVIDPWIGAIQIHHAQQEGQLVGKNHDEFLQQIRRFHGHLDRFSKTLAPRWRESFAACIREIPVENRVTLIERMVPLDKCREYWASAPPFALEVRDMMIADFPDEVRSRVDWRWHSPEPAGGVKQRIRQAMPPGVWNFARTVGRALRHGVEVRVRS
jgi:glycosyltransferase involved in cell wall biosynthesis